MDTQIQGDHDTSRHNHVHSELGGFNHLVYTLLDRFNVHKLNLECKGSRWHLP